MKALISYAAAAVLLFAGCFYSFTGGGLPGVKSVAIPMADYKGSEFQLREKITNQIIDKFMQDGTLKVGNLNTADTILRCTISKSPDRSTAINQNEVAQQFELSINVSIKLEDRKTGKIILTKSVNGKSTYSDLSARNTAMEEAIEMVTDNVLEEIISAW